MGRLTQLYRSLRRASLKFLAWEVFWTLKFLSFKKVTNFFKASYEKFIVRPKVLTSFPTKLTIDATAHCQLHCPLCPTGQGNPARLRGNMTFADFRKLIDEVGDYLWEVDLFNWGEPFLNKDIFRMIAYGHQKKIKVRVSSNLNHFPLGFERGLVESKLHHLVVSLDGITQATYGQYRVGGSLKKVVEAVQRIAAEKKRQRVPFPFLTWQFIVMRHNEHEVGAAKKLVQKWGFDRLVFAQNRGDMGQELLETDRRKVEKYRQWLPEKSQETNFDLAKKVKKYKAATCHRPWQEAVVNWNGSVSPCCLFYEEKYDFGNALERGFAAVWNNEKYREARQLIKSGKSEDKALVCWNCIWNGFPE